MHQEQFAVNEQENNELRKRHQQVLDQWTRLDIECARLTDDLQQAKGQLDSLRNECANLRAEKQIWQVRYCIRTFRVVC
jgi:nucleoprotein TPR